MKEMIFGLVSGLIISIYAGYIILKLSEFRALRENACKALLKIENGNEEWENGLRESASALKRLGHTTASAILFESMDQIRKINTNSVCVSENLAEIIESSKRYWNSHNRIEKLKKKIERIKPNIKSILF